MQKSAVMRQILAKQGMLIVPGVHDALSARIVEEAGFEAVYLSGSMLSSSYGMPDMNILTMTEMVSRAASITAAVDIPLIADADTGYGNAINVIRTVREYERAGAAGITLEDQVFPKKCGHYPGKAIISIPEMVGKLHAALDCRIDKDFIIVARTDAATSMGIEEAIRRSCAYIDAGADVIFVVMHKSPQIVDEARLVCSALSKPVMFDFSLSSSHVPALPELGSVGLKIALIPAAITYTAITAMRRAAREMRESGLEGVMRVLERTDPRDSILELWDVNGTIALSEKYSEQAMAAKGNS